MRIISHRGNLNGEDKFNENKLDQISNVINNYGYDVEIDIWKIDGKLYLGHDKPEEEVSDSFLFDNNDYLWIHCKNIEAADCFTQKKNNLNYFFHQADDCTLTSRNFIWVYPGKRFTPNSVLVENDATTLKTLIKENLYGVCTDFPVLLGSLLSEK